MLAGGCNAISRHSAARSTTRTTSRISVVSRATPAMRDLSTSCPTSMRPEKSNRPPTRRNSRISLASSCWPVIQSRSIDGVRAVMRFCPRGEEAYPRRRSRRASNSSTRAEEWISSGMANLCYRSRIEVVTKPVPSAKADWDRCTSVDPALPCLAFTFRRYAGLDAGGGARATLAVAKIDLAVGGVWLVASRFGVRPMGIQEPIGLLTGVHFHFAGFATATIAAATLLSAQKRRQKLWLKRVVALVVGLPYLVAAGFVISPALKMGAGLMFSASVAVLALFLRDCGKRAHDPTARVLLQAASAAVFAGMVLSSTYAVADLLGSDVLTIPQMARTHGILNALGFCMLGLLGWLVESSSQ